MHDFDMEAIVKSLILNNDEKQGIRQQSIKLSSKFKALDNFIHAAAGIGIDKNYFKDCKTLSEINLNNQILILKKEDHVREELNATFSNSFDDLEKGADGPFRWINNLAGVGEIVICNNTHIEKNIKFKSQILLSENSKEVDHPTIGISVNDASTAFQIKNGIEISFDINLNCGNNKIAFYSNIPSKKGVRDERLLSIGFQNTKIISENEVLFENSEKLLGNFYKSKLLEYISKLHMAGYYYVEIYNVSNSRPKYLNRIFKSVGSPMNEFHYDLNSGVIEQINLMNSCVDIWIVGSKYYKLRD